MEKRSGRFAVFVSSAACRARWSILRPLWVRVLAAVGLFCGVAAAQGTYQFTQPNGNGPLFIQDPNGFIGDCFQPPPGFLFCRTIYVAGSTQKASIAMKASDSVTGTYDPNLTDPDSGSVFGGVLLGPASFSVTTTGLTGGVSGVQISNGAPQFSTGTPRQITGFKPDLGVTSCSGGSGGFQCATNGLHAVVLGDPKNPKYLVKINMRVQLTTNIGQPPWTGSFGFEFLWALEQQPSITSISPAVASNSPKMPYAATNSPNGLEVTITGTNLPTSGISISLGDIQVGSYGLSDPTTINMKLSAFANLPEGDRDLIIKDSAGKEVAKLPKAFFVSSLGVELEVNQGVPMKCAERSCISGHDTVIRAHVTCIGKDCEYGKGITTGRLFVRKDGQPFGPTPGAIGAVDINFSPAHSVTVFPNGTAVPLSFARESFDTLNFYFFEALPASEIMLIGGNQLGAGNYDFILVVNARDPAADPEPGDSKDPYNRKRNLVIDLQGQRFQKSVVDLRFIALTDVRAGEGQDFPPQIISAFNYLRAAYPISKSMVNITPVYDRVTYVTDSLSNESNTVARLQSILTRLNEAGVRGKLFFFTSNPAFTANGFSTCYSPVLFSEGLLPPQITCTHEISIVKVGDEMPATIAHEAGHHLLLGDTYQPTEGNAERSTYNDPKAPEKAAGCLALGNGCPVEPGHFDPIQALEPISYYLSLGNKVWVPPNGFVSVTVTNPSGGLDPIQPSPRDSGAPFNKRDFMGGGDRRLRWVDQRTWDYLYEKFNSPGQQLGSQGEKAVPKAAAGKSALQISGIIRDDGAADLFPCVPMDLRDDPMPLPPAGEYSVVFYDAAGTALQSATFQPAFRLGHISGSSPVAPFVVTLPASPVPSRIAVKKGAAELASRKVSPNPPVVQLVYPTGGETVGRSPLPLQWSASDADGDPLTYSVLYSPDDGATWMTVAVNITDNHLLWDTTPFPGGTNGRIRVVANDGVNESAAISGPFALAAKPPLVSIDYPSDGDTVTGGPISFQGFGFSAQEGELPAGSLAFSSDRDGPLGSGRTLSAKNLSVGLHTITLTGADSGGNRGSASIRITYNGAGPQISGITPSSGAPGAAVSINGSGFSTSPGQNAVRFGAAQTQVISATSTQIRTTVPAGLSPGTTLVTVTVNDVTSTPMNFAVLSAAPVILVTPGQLDFGNVTVRTSQSKTIAITNSGNAALNVTGLTTAAPFSVISPAPPLAVASGASSTIAVAFAPTSTGALTGMLTISSDDAAKPTVTVSLTGTGTSSGPVPAPAIDVSPTTLDFGSVAAGQFKDLTLTIRNNGIAVLTVNSVSSSNSRFSLVNPSTGFNVEPGTAQTLGVRFAPTAAGSQTGTLMGASNDPVKPTVTVNLTGTAPGTTGGGTTTLSLDDGSFEQVAGITGGAPASYFLTRLTPPSYPATLKSVQIMFLNAVNTLKAGDSIRVLIGVNPSGSANINNVQLLGAATMVGAVGQLNGYDTPVTTIRSGDFVVGFTAGNPAGIFPAALDTTPPNRQRSYVSVDGVNFQLLDTGNLGIRAVVDLGPGPDGSSAVINPAGESLMFEPLQRAQQ